jgi:hypothetical protein
MKAPAIIFLLCVAALVACDESLTTHTRSSTFATDAEKVAFLDRYLELCSPVEATEFIIDYWDNSGGAVPGPSDWDIRAAMKVPRDLIACWRQGRTRVDTPVDLSWSRELLAEDATWRTTSTPEVYRDGGSLVAVFEQEGVVVVRMTTMLEPLAYS